MEIIRLFKEIVMVLLICKGSWSISVEPKYTKFMYEEQLLEKMVRLEMFVENMENDMKKFMSESTTVAKEIQNSTKGELDKLAERMNRFETEMDTFRMNVTSTLNNSLQTNIEQRGFSLYAEDCFDIKKEVPRSSSGVYSVSLWKSKQKVQVLCDMDTDGGGWTIFQKRFNGSVDFYRSFKEYEGGFGQLNGEFWLGLKTIHEIAAKGKSELRLDLTAADNSHVYEVFQNFFLSDGPQYTLHIDKGTGTAGDSSGLSYSNGHNFYTRDNDNSQKCAEKDHGGWWYLNCAHANLNGHYVTPGTKAKSRAESGVIYRDFKSEESLKSTLMMVRRVKES